MLIAWVRRHARILDAAFVVILAAMLAVPWPEIPAPWQHRSTSEKVLLIVVLAGPLLVRWRWPRAVFGFLAVATLATWPVDQAFVAHVVLPLAGYAMTVSLERSAATKAALAGLLVLLVPSVWAVPNGDAGRVAEPVVWTALGCALGMAVAGQRRYFREAHERVRAAEQSREEEAARRVAEERLRISRELHDVIAHHISVINVQAGVAGHLLRVDPDTAEQALRTVRDAAQTVLQEMGGVLAVLRRDPGTEDPRAPAPGLAQIPRLVTAIQDQGHAVTLEVDGVPRNSPAAIELTAYRVVQEALTNVHKHAPSAAAMVRLAWQPDLLTVSVTNSRPRPAARRPAAGHGFGLVGMRERVAAIGGVLVTEATTGGGFLVQAELPVEGSAS